MKPRREAERLANALFATQAPDVVEVEVVDGDLLLLAPLSDGIVSCQFACRPGLADLMRGGPADPETFLEGWPADANDE